MICKGPCQLETVAENLKPVNFVEWEKCLERIESRLATIEKRLERLEESVHQSIRGEEN